MINMHYVWSSLIYSGIGIAILIITFVLVEIVTPDNLVKEVIEKKNMAVALMASAFMIAIAIIISSAIHG
jgi:putative membrane protein